MMARVLFVVIPEKGHINPYIGPAQELQKRGHEIAFYALHDITPQLRAAGFPRFFPGSDENPAPPDANRGKFFAEKVRDKDWLRNWIKTLLVDFVPPQVDVLRRIVRDFRPDVLAIDSMVYQGAIVAELEKIPYAGLSSSLNPVADRSFTSELMDTVQWLSPARDALFASYGVKAEFRVCDVVSPWVNTVFATRSFVEPDSPPPQTFLVGPSIPGGRRGDEPPYPKDLKPRLIYMSLGSQIYYQPEAFHTVIEAIRGRQVQLVLSVNELSKMDSMADLPRNVVALPYAPQLHLLRVHAHVMITHGGANSVMEALWAGVPLLIHPICNDQFYQARCIERSGVGRRIDLDRAKSSEVWAAIDSLRRPEPYRQKAREVGTSYRNSDGALIAARLVEHLAAQRRPIVRRDDSDINLLTSTLEPFLASQ
jgi:MGT family glycosyltransferase